MFQHLKREPPSTTAFYPSSVSDILPWGFFNSHLSNLEMHIVFLEDEDHVLKYEQTVFFIQFLLSEEYFCCWTFMIIAISVFLKKLSILQAFSRVYVDYFDLCTYIAFPLLKCPWQSTNSFVSRTHRKL